MSDYQPSPPPSTPYTQYSGGQASPPQTLSILSLVFGILGTVGSLFYGIGLLPGIAGVILGFIARRREPHAKGLWITGIITGFVGIGIAVLWIIGIIVFFVLAASNGAFSS